MVKLDEIKLKEINFSKDLVVSDPNTKLSDVLKVLRMKNGKPLIIIDQGKVIGTFSAKDYLLKVSLEDPFLFEEKIVNLMTPNPLLCFLDQSVAHALEKISTSNNYYIILIDEQEKPVGLLNPLHIVKFLSLKIK